MVIDDILYKYPQMEEVFREAGIRCFGWGGALYMTVEQAARKYSIDSEKLVKNLNEAL